MNVSNFYHLEGEFLGGLSSDPLLRSILDLTVNACIGIHHGLWTVQRTNSAAKADVSFSWSLDFVLAQWERRAYILQSNRLNSGGIHREET